MPHYSDAYDTQWMTELEKSDLYDSVNNLTAAFNDLEAIVLEYGEMSKEEYELDCPTFARLCSDCTFIYNECERIINDYGGYFNKRELEYLRHLRITCAHYSGLTTNSVRYYNAVIYAVIPLKEKIRSMLYEVIDSNNREDLSDAVKQFNRKKRSFFRSR